MCRGFNGSGGARGWCPAMRSCCCEASLPDVAPCTVGFLFELSEQLLSLASLPLVLLCAASRGAHRPAPQEVRMPALDAMPEPQVMRDRTAMRGHARNPKAPSSVFFVSPAHQPYFFPSLMRSCRPLPLLSRVLVRYRLLTARLRPVHEGLTPSPDCFRAQAQAAKHATYYEGHTGDDGLNACRKETGMKRKRERTRGGRWDFIAQVAEISPRGVCLDSISRFSTTQRVPCFKYQVSQYLDHIFQLVRRSALLISSSRK